MSDDRFKEVFSRINSATPNPPSFSDLETQRAMPHSPTWMKPWMAVAGAAALVLVVVGVVGSLGGGGPDLAQPDGETVHYIKLEYSASVNPVCEGGEIVDNGGFNDAVIEIWGPNSDDLTLMVATFPDGSTERGVVKGDPFAPEHAWAIDDDDFADKTGFKIVACSIQTRREGSATSGNTRLLDPPYAPGYFPPDFLGVPPGSISWDQFYATAGFVKGTREWRGYEVVEYKLDRKDEDIAATVSNFVSFDEPKQLLGQVVAADIKGIGTVSWTIDLATKDEVPAADVSFDTAGLVEVDFAIRVELPPEACPVTIPSRSMTPPEGYPETPSGYPDNYWFGKDELFTSLPTDGEYQPRKSVWWSTNFGGGGVENEPDITVTWTLLNSGRDLTITEDRGTNAHTESEGWFMIAGIDPPIQGCWQVTAIYKGASLSYVYYNNSYGNRVGDIVVPDVVGMTVERARRVLDDNLYEASFVGSANPGYEVCSQDPAPGAELNPWEPVTIDAAPAGQCSGAYEPPEPTLEFNPDFETYQDSLGRTYYLTACPNNDVLVIAGVDGADGLPPIGQTEQQRVEGFVNAQTPNSDGYLLQRVGLIDLEAVPRNGSVWSRVDGAVMVTQEPDYMLKGTITEDFRCPQVPVFYNGMPIAYVREDGKLGGCPDRKPDPLPSQVLVFYNCSSGGAVFPNPIPVTRPLQPGGDKYTWTFRALLDGPTDAEISRGFGSFIDGQANALNATSFDDGDLVVMFNDLIKINNASTSTGSMFFLAELYATAFQYQEVESVTFSLDNSCEAFWGWLQRDCQTIARADWEGMQPSWEE